VLPLLLLLTLAVVQVGLLARDQLAVTQAARAAARQAAVETDEGAVREAALKAAGVLDPGLVEVAVTREGSRGDPVTVIVAYRDPLRVPLLSWLLPAEVTLEASMTARQEFG
jgi:Flp pilus assembly protein TadG